MLRSSRIKTALYYTPGLITLTGILVLISHHLSSTLLKSRRYAIELTCSDKPKGCCMGAEPYAGEYIQFDLTGNPPHDKMVFNKSAPLLRDIFHKKDTTRLVYYTLSDNATYGAFISLLNFLLKEHVGNYVLDTDGVLWVGPYIPDLCERRWGRQFGRS